MPAVSTSLHRNAADGDGFAHQIARGAGSGGHDGAFPFDQTIKQARLAHVGAADDGERQAFVHELAVGEGRRPVARAERERRRCAGEFASAGRTETSSSAKSTPASSVAISSTKLLLDGLQAAGQRAFQLLGGDFGLVERLRVDQVADGFGLGEIDAAVEEGAHGELAGLGQAGAAGESELDNVAQEPPASRGRRFR